MMSNITISSGKSIPGLGMSSIQVACALMRAVPSARVCLA